jgi:geranylgeranyl pyrophosphate synthase
MEEQPRLRALAGRCFEHAGDVEEALQLVLSSNGIQRSRYVCTFARARVLWCSW